MPVHAIRNIAVKLWSMGRGLYVFLTGKKMVAEETNPQGICTVTCVWRLCTIRGCLDA